MTFIIWVIHYNYVPECYKMTLIKITTPSELAAFIAKQFPSAIWYRWEENNSMFECIVNKKFIEMGNLIYISEQSHEGTKKTGLKELKDEINY